jgi:hypothetical protein
LDKELEKHGCASKALTNCLSTTWQNQGTGFIDKDMAAPFLDVEDENIAMIAFSPLGQATFIDEYFIYKVENLVADIGGYMGLFLGASCLSIFELVLSAVKKIFCSKFSRSRF